MQCAAHPWGRSSLVARRRLPTLRRGAVPRIARRAAAPCTAAAAGDAAPGEGAALQPERQDLKTTLGGALSGFNKALFGGADASSASSSAAQQADPPAPSSTAQAPGSPAEGAAAVSASASTGEGADAAGTASPAAEAGAGGAPTDPIESWDRPNAESDWEPAGFGGAPPQPPRRPSRLGNFIFGSVVVLAALAAGALYNRAAAYRAAGHQRQVPAATAAVGGSTTARRSAERAQPEHQQLEQRIAAASPSGQQQAAAASQQRAAALEGAEAGASTLEFEAPERAAGSTSGGGQEQGVGRALEAAPSTASPALTHGHHGPTHPAALEHHSPGEQHSGKEAALARIRELQAQHLREQEQTQHAQHPQQEPSARAALVQPPAGAEALAPFGSREEQWVEQAAAAQADHSGEPAPAVSAERVGGSGAASSALDEAVAKGERWAQRADRAAQQAAAEQGGEGGGGRSWRQPGTAVGEYSDLGNFATDDEAAAAEVPTGMSLDALSQRARAANKAAAAAAQAAHRAADASVLAAEAAHRAAQHAQQAMSASASAQSALQLQADDAIEAALKRANDAEAVATEAADQAALAAAQGSMGEADASKQARKAVAAAELSKPYSVTDQVAGWWRSARRAVAANTQLLLHFLAEAAHRAQQASSAAVQFVRSTVTAAQQAVVGLWAAAQRWWGQGVGGIQQLGARAGAAAHSSVAAVQAAWGQLLHWVQHWLPGRK